MDAVPTDTILSGELVFRGIGVSAGIAMGRAFLRTPPDDQVVERVEAGALLGLELDGQAHFAVIGGGRAGVAAYFDDRV